MTTITRPASPDARRRLDGAVPPPRGQALARNRGRIALGVLLLAVSALLAVAVYSNIGDRQPVLVVARTIDPGDVIEADDLAVVRVAAEPGVETMPESQRSAVIGMRSSVRLLPGSLVIAGALSDGPPRAPGTSVIGALVRSGQYPLGLRSGDEVLVVITGDAVSSERDPIAATIVSIAASGGPDGTPISLSVPASNAPRLAVAGAEGRLVLVVPPS